MDFLFFLGGMSYIHGKIVISNLSFLYLNTIFSFSFFLACLLFFHMLYFHWTINMFWKISWDPECVFQTLCRNVLTLTPQFQQWVIHKSSIPHILRRWHMGIKLCITSPEFTWERVWQSSNWFGENNNGPKLSKFLMSPN